MRKFVRSYPKKRTTNKVRLGNPRTYTVRKSSTSWMGSYRAGSQPYDQHDDLMNNVTLTDNDQNETIIPGKSTKGVMSQLEVEGECVEDQVGKISDPGDPISSVAD